MTSHEQWVAYLGETAAEAVDAHHRALTAARNADPSSEQPTPLYDQTAAALAAAAGLTPPPTADASADDTEDWLEEFTNPADPPVSPLLDPDTPEGAAIMRLFRALYELEQRHDGSWPGADVVDILVDWFVELGIDPDTNPIDAGVRLRLALRDHPGGGLFSAVYGVRIGTDNADPEQIVRAALRELATQLGPGTGIDLVGINRGVIERIEQPTASTAAG